jgi:sulfate adenylyltransferase (ADP) / ATP adenylyltransferase
MTRILGGDALWRQVREKGRQALASGALVTLGTRLRNLDDGGLRIIVRVAEEPAEKAALAAARAGGDDPFCPPLDEDLLVGEVTRTHLALLNKYRVLDDHLLLITREHVEQHMPLEEADFNALLRAFAGVDGLAFYNSAPEAGASRAWTRNGTKPGGSTMSPSTRWK